MSEYTFETAALKAVTIDAVKYNEEGLKNSLTPEAIQAVVPIAWREWTTPPTCNGTVSSLAIGENAQSYAFSDQTIAIGKDSYSIGLALGQKSRAYDRANVIGIDSYGVILSNVFGHKAKAYGDMGVTIGSEYGENVDGNVIFRTCTTEGSGSITIGAGANTLNNGDTESSNSVTIGCKASNISFDSVVIGAQASNENGNSVAVGAGAKTMIGDAVAVGKNATASSWRTVAVGQSSTASGVWSSAFGCYSRATEQNATALGIGANAKAQNATAVGYYAVAADVGVMVFRSESADRTSTQLYFSGANTPLANTYHGGAPMLGYVTKDSAGNIVAAGTRSLIDLLTDNSTFAPASLDENGEWVMPKVFHPSDLDMPQEEPSEPEEYQPLPVYPIVEPEIEPLTE